MNAPQLRVPVDRGHGHVFETSVLATVAADFWPIARLRTRTDPLHPEAAQTVAFAVHHRDGNGKADVLCLDHRLRDDALDVGGGEPGRVRMPGSSKRSHERRAPSNGSGHGWEAL